MNTKFDTNITEAQFIEGNKAIGRFVAKNPCEVRALLESAGVKVTATTRPDLLDELYANIGKEKVKSGMAAILDNTFIGNNSKKNEKGEDVLNLSDAWGGVIGGALQLGGAIVGATDKTGLRIAQANAEAQKEMAKSMENQAALAAQAGMFKGANSVKVVAIVGVSVVVLGVLGIVAYSALKSRKKAKN